MALFKATKDGNVPMTPQEEAEIRAKWAAADAIMVSLPVKKQKLRDAVNAKKKELDASGVNIAGVNYSTAFVSRLEISNAYILITRNPDRVVSIDANDGDVATLTAANVGTVFDQVNAKFEGINAARKQHFDAIRLLNKDNIDSYDVNTLWP